MSRQADWRKRKRALLRRLLGDCCAKCGSERRLEFAHYPGTRTWSTKDYGSYQRIIRYWRDYLKGYLYLLCHKCHSKEPDYNKH